MNCTSETSLLHFEIYFSSFTHLPLTEIQCWEPGEMARMQTFKNVGRLYTSGITTSQRHWDFVFKCISSEITVRSLFQAISVCFVKFM